MRVTTQSSAATHTVDCIVFGFSEGVLRVLLVHRHIDPYAESWVLPGGAMTADDSLEETARRVMSELVGVSDLHLQQVKTYSKPDRHPVRRVVTTSFYALVKPEHHRPHAVGYLSDARWTALDEVPQLGFDHGQLLRDAHDRLIMHLRSRPLAFDLLPTLLTLSEAQQLYEEILNEKLDRRNFRRKLLTYDFLVETDKKRAGVKGGPTLFRVDKAALREVLDG